MSSMILLPPRAPAIAPTAVPTPGNIIDPMAAPIPAPPRELHSCDPQRGIKSLIFPPIPKPCIKLPATRPAPAGPRYEAAGAPPIAPPDAAIVPVTSAAAAPPIPVAGANETAPPEGITEVPSVVAPA